MKTKFVLAERQDYLALRRALSSAGAVFKRDRACTCPFHNDTHPSMGLWDDEQGVWRCKCLACGAGGDVYDVLKLAGREVAPRSWSVGLQSGSVAVTTKPAPPPPKPPLDQDEFLRIVGSGKWWFYTDAMGESIAAVGRTEGRDGKKKFLQMHKSGKEWYWGGLPPPRPVYQLWEAVRAGVGDTVVVVEGEKCADVLISLGICATTSMGGSSAATKTNWAPLTKSKARIIIWPDDDEPGHKYAMAVQQQVPQAEILRLELIPDAEYFVHRTGWDVADYIEMLIALGLRRKQRAARVREALGIKEKQP